MTLLTKIKIIIGVVIGVLAFIGGVVLSIFIQNGKDKARDKITGKNDILIDNQKPIVKEIIEKEKGNEKTDIDNHNRLNKLKSIKF
jgi:hypothetical protein